MILFIDTTDYTSATFALAGERVFRKTYKIDPHNSHETLGRLAAFLKSSRIKMGDIKKIVVNKGPGSFTGIRVGAAHALALSLSWGVPLKALAKEQFIMEMNRAIKKRS